MKRELKHFPQFLSVAFVALVAISVAFGTAVTLTSRAATIPGDLNSDGTVNVLDLSLLLSSWGKSGVAADLNSDGTVNVFDLSLLLTNWGKTSTTTPTPTPTKTPTPSTTTSPTPIASIPPGTGPCNRGVAAPAQYKHVILITFENYSYAHYLSDSRLTYTRSIAAQCGSASNFYGITEPSLPNYIALASGGTQGLVGSDANPHNPGTLTADNIFNQVKQSGRQSSQIVLKLNFAYHGLI